MRDVDDHSNVGINDHSNVGIDVSPGKVIINLIRRDAAIVI